MFYVDRFANELVTEREDIAPPERYFEYVRGAEEGFITETYVVSENPLKLLSLQFSTCEPPWMATIQKQNYFKKHGVSENARLYRYTVPPSWYDEQVAKYEGRSIAE